MVNRVNLVLHIRGRHAWAQAPTQAVTFRQRAGVEADGGHDQNVSQNPTGRRMWNQNQGPDWFRRGGGAWL